MLRSASTGRPRTWNLQSRRGGHAVVEPATRMWFNDPQAMCEAAVAGLGLALCALVHARRHLESGALVRVLPGWWCDVGAIRLYFPSTRLMPAKTRVFVDHVTAALQARGLAKAMSAAG
jgi:DNA-binding transcriptional LysR family regulator